MINIRFSNGRTSTFLWERVFAVQEQVVSRRYGAGTAISALLTTMDTDTMLKIKYMPSEHWLELVECWSCHRDEFANIVKNTAEISAVPGCLLVGTDYYLLNKEDIKQCTCMIYEEGAGGIKIDKDDILLDGKSTSFESVLYELLKESD